MYLTQNERLQKRDSAKDFYKINMACLFFYFTLENSFFNNLYLQTNTRLSYIFKQILYFLNH